LKQDNHPSEPNMIGASCVLLYIYSFQVRYIQIQMREALFGV